MIYAQIQISQIVDFCCKCIISLSLFLCWTLKIKEDLIKGFPTHCGVCPWLTPYLVSSCIGLSSAFYIYVLSAVYLYVDVIANMEKKLNKFLQHRTYLNLTVLPESINTITFFFLICPSIFTVWGVVILMNALQDMVGFISSLFEVGSWCISSYFDVSWFFSSSSSQSM